MEGRMIVTHGKAPPMLCENADCPNPGREHIVLLDVAGERTCIACYHAMRKPMGEKRKKR